MTYYQSILKNLDRESFTFNTLKSQMVWCWVNFQGFSLFKSVLEPEHDVSNCVQCTQAFGRVNKESIPFEDLLNVCTEAWEAFEKLSMRRELLRYVSVNELASFPSLTQALIYAEEPIAENLTPKQLQSQAFAFEEFSEIIDNSKTLLISWGVADAYQSFLAAKKKMIRQRVKEMAPELEVFYRKRTEELLEKHVENPTSEREARDLTLETFKEHLRVSADTIRFYQSLLPQGTLEAFQTQLDKALDCLPSTSKALQKLEGWLLFDASRDPVAKVLYGLEGSDRLALAPNWFVVSESGSYSYNSFSFFWVKPEGLSEDPNHTKVKVPDGFSLTVSQVEVLDKLFNPDDETSPYYDLKNALNASLNI